MSSEGNQDCKKLGTYAISCVVILSVIILIEKLLFFLLRYMLFLDVLAYIVHYYLNKSI